MPCTKPKNLAVSGGATAALLGAFLLGGVALNHAGAAPLAPAGPAAAAVREAPDAAEANDPAVDPALAHITADQARTAALARFPGATIDEVALHDQDGTLVWAVALTDAGGADQELAIDATTGQVAASPTDGADQPDQSDQPDQPGGAADTESGD